MAEQSPLFGDGDPVGPGGWVAIVLATLSGLGNVLQGLYTSRLKAKQDDAKAKQDSENAAIVHLNAMLDRQEKTIEKMGHQLQKALDEVSRSRVAHEVCQREFDDLWADRLAQHEWQVRVHAAATGAGLLVGPLPARPEPRQHRVSAAEAEYALRQRRHEAELLLRESEEQKSSPAKGRHEIPPGG